jgi:hypothetical protein
MPIQMRWLLAPEVVCSRPQGSSPRDCALGNAGVPDRRRAGEAFRDEIAPISVSGVSVDAHLGLPSPYFSPLVMNEAF